MAYLHIDCSSVQALLDIILYSIIILKTLTTPDEAANFTPLLKDEFILFTASDAEKGPISFNFQHTHPRMLETILPCQALSLPLVHPTPCRHTLRMWGTACSPLHQSGCSLHFLMKGLSGSTPAPGQSLTTPLCWCKGPPTSPPGVIRGPDTGVIN